MSKLQSYVNKVKKDYAFEIQLDKPVEISELEKKLIDFGVSTLKENSTGQYQLVLSYPITGQELLTRICENTNNLVTVQDNAGQIFSNKPLPKEEPAPVIKEETIPEVEPITVVEIKKPILLGFKETLDISKIVTGVNELLTNNFENLRQALTEENIAATAQQTSLEVKTLTAISAINENITSLQEAFIQMRNEVTRLNTVVAEAMNNYNNKLVELAESNNRLNHRVVKNVKRDDRGYITEVTEQIITEK